MKKVWWKESIVYQIYPRSFSDGNNDGIGDLRGIIEKLEYIKNLGVDVIWLCPIYKSPNDDNGYDISDYQTIMDEFGTMQDFDELLDKAHDMDLKIILDLVVNHSSDEHQWFQASKKSVDNPYRNYYYWKDGIDGAPPNNWPSFFKGSVWEYDEATDQYYLHLFSKKQPDLNWENPTVRKEVYNLMHFWLKKGIDGFRMDVIPLISKDTLFPSTNYQNFDDIIHHVYANGPRVHEFIQEMHREVTSKYDILTVGEGPGITPEIVNRYVSDKRNELNMVFHFDHLFLGSGKNGKYDPVPWTLPTFKTIFKTWDDAVGADGWNSIFLGNHDFSRIVSRFGDDKVHRETSAKLLAMLLLTMRGTVYLYQGDEIGMTNVAYESIDEYNDIETINTYKEKVASGSVDMDEFMKIVHDQSRDNARTPMQWNDSSNGGFSTRVPWLKSNPNYKYINVEQCEKDAFSILNFYRRMIECRKRYLTLVYGDFEIYELSHPKLFIYTRSDEKATFLIVLNFSGEETFFSNQFEIASCLISNYADEKQWTEKGLLLKPWEASLFKLNQNG